MHEFELLIFDVVLVIFNKYLATINDMSCTTSIHGDSVEILVVGRLQIMDDEGKMYRPVLCGGIWQIGVIVEIKFGQFFWLRNKIERNECVLNRCSIDVEENEHGYDEDCS